MNLVVYFFGHDEVTPFSTTSRSISDKLNSDWEQYNVEYPYAEPIRALAKITSDINGLKSQYERLYLVGNGLGAYWAKIASRTSNLPVILLNEMYDPSVSLKDELSDEQIAKYKSMTQYAKNLFYSPSFMSIPAYKIGMDSETVVKKIQE